MKQAVILAFSGNGRAIAEMLKRKFEDIWSFTDLSGEAQKKERLKEIFPYTDVVIFVSATGIAVRYICDLIKDKYMDPAVICMDEKGKFVIPLCGGHMAGGNAYAEMIAQTFSSIPVIATATDVNRKFAVDLFAKKNGFHICDRNKVKEISGRVINGEQIKMYSKVPLRGEKPEEILLVGNKEEADIIIDTSVYKKGLTLLVRPIVLGIGCRRGTSEREIADAIQAAFLVTGRKICETGLIASIDLKRHEQGLIQTAKTLETPFVTYSSGELECIKTVSKESEFVKKITGTGNVSERAALLGSGGGRLLIPKTVYGHVTLSVAEKKKEGIF